jgi:hypothetical protein
MSHVIGDFYLQSDKTAREKDICPKTMAIHGGIYAICVFAVLFAGLEFDVRIWKLAAFASVSHIITDVLKPKIIKRYTFITDQIIHVACLVMGWLVWGRALAVRPFIMQEIGHLPHSPILIFLTALCVLRPVSIFIDSGAVWEGFKNEKDNNEKTVRKLIGYLERLVIMFLLMYGEFGGVAFVLTAKSVARYKEIDETMDAGYYLIGTVTSVVSTFVICLFLGICGEAV